MNLQPIFHPADWNLRKIIKTWQKLAYWVFAYPNPKVVLEQI